MNRHDRTRSRVMLTKTMPPLYRPRTTAQLDNRPESAAKLSSGSRYPRRTPVFPRKRESSETQDPARVTGSPLSRE
ncbi:hypothetical protein GCM10011329_26290 [Stakelama pacifica]|nr:hypothetical protein GCM10011329_26290 [Stakelama pacifica]